jgi:hypothetical protein
MLILASRMTTFNQLHIVSGNGLTTPYSKITFLRNATQDLGAGPCEHDNEPSGYIKGG